MADCEGTSPSLEAVKPSRDLEVHVVAEGGPKDEGVAPALRVHLGRHRQAAGPGNMS